jgi:hypothetical protein
MTHVLTWYMVALTCRSKRGNPWHLMPDLAIENANQHHLACDSSCNFTQYAALVLKEVWLQAGVEAIITLSPHSPMRESPHPMLREKTSVTRLSNEFQASVSQELWRYFETKVTGDLGVAWALLLPIYRLTLADTTAVSYRRTGSRAISSAREGLSRTDPNWSYRHQ